MDDSLVEYINGRGMSSQYGFTVRAVSIQSTVCCENIHFKMIEIKCLRKRTIYKRNGHVISMAGFYCSGSTYRLLACLGKVVSSSKCLCSPLANLQKEAS